MANNLSIIERTLAQLSDSTNSVNVIGGAGGRDSVYQPLTIRVTDHVDDDNAEADDANLMALFVSCRHGEPFKKDSNVLTHKVQSVGQGATGTVADSGGVIDTPVVTAGGSGYYADNTIAVFGGGGTGATATIVVENGVIISFVMTSGGTGYTSPTVTFSSPADTDVSVLYPDFDYSTFE